MQRLILTLALLPLCLVAAGADWVTQLQPDLDAQLRAAKPMKVEEVCEPVKATTVANFWLIPNVRQNGLDALQWYYKGYKGPTSVAICDLREKVVSVQEFPTGKQINAAGWTIDRDGKVWIASPGGISGADIFTYDPDKNELAKTDLHIPDLGDHQRLTLGTDGLLYGMGSNFRSKTAGLYVIDPKTGTLDNIGPIGPPSTYVMSACADDTHVYYVARKGEWHLVAYDKATRKTEVLQSTGTAGAIFVYQKEFGCHSQGRGYKGLPDGPHHFWLYKGKAIEHVDHSNDWPWKEPERPAARKAIQPEIDKDALPPGPDGTAMFRYRYGKGPWTEAPFAVPMYPVETHRLVSLPDGRLMGKAGFYHGEFIVDPKTDTGKHLARSGVSYNGFSIFVRGKMYSAGYPSSILTSLDPDAPIKPFKGDPARDVTLPADAGYNPRPLAYLRKWTGTHSITGTAVGADGRVYFCGNSYRDTNRGGLGWWDIDKDEGGGVWEPFSNVAISFMISSASGKYLVFSTFPKKDVELKKPAPKLGKLMVWDVAASKVIREIEPVPGSQWSGMIAPAGGTRLIGLTMAPNDPESYILYGADILTGEIAFRKKVPNPEKSIRPHSHQGKYPWNIYPGPDGKLYTMMRACLCRIDPEDARITVLGRVGAPGNMAWIGRDLYMAGLTEVRRIRGVALPTPAAKD